MNKEWVSIKIRYILDIYYCNSALDIQNNKKKSSDIILEMTRKPKKNKSFIYII